MDMIDHSAQLAALEAAAAAQAIFDQRPNLTAAERSAVIGNSLARAYDGYLGCYIRSEADAAFRQAIDEVCTELAGGSSASGGFTFEHSSTDDHENDDWGLSPHRAAELLAERRRS